MNDEKQDTPRPDGIEKEPDQPTPVPKRQKKSGRRKKLTKGKGAWQTPADQNDPKVLADFAKRIHALALDVQLKKDIWPKVEDPKKRRYLFARAESGNKVQAAKAAEIQPTLPYCPTWQGDTAFQAALAEADEASADMLETEAWRRAVEGVTKPIGWYKGKAGGFVREFSDILLIVLLKAARPELYKDRIEVRGMFANIDFSRLPDELIARLSDGENPVSVLGGWLGEQREAKALLGPGKDPTGEP